jgi:hydroxyacylglutathione hydrolase
MAHLDIHHFICREDNYGVLIHDTRTGATASIDAPDALAVEKALKQKGWQLTHILTTHHHGDHVEGNLALKEMFGCKIIGPRNDGDIPGIDQKVAGGETYTFADREVRVIDTPGHTKGHIVLHLPSEHLLFAGDTLFAMGCGRVIEGTLEQMWQSLDKLRALPVHTTVHVGHEYTEANARFALTIEPGNRALQQRAAVVAAQRAKGQMTLPTTIGEELKTNVFLRPDSKDIRAKLALEQASDAEVFAETRRRKDSFK